MKDCCKAYLDEQFGGDADIENEIYGEYVASIGGKIAEAEETLAAENWDALDKVFHTIKGNGLMVGDQEMADTAIALRCQAKLHDSAACAAGVAKLKEIAVGL